MRAIICPVNIDQEKNIKSELYQPCFFHSLSYTVSLESQGMPGTYPQSDMKKKAFSLQGCKCQMSLWLQAAESIGALLKKVVCPGLGGDSVSEAGERDSGHPVSTPAPPENCAPGPRQSAQEVGALSSGQS